MILRSLILTIFFGAVFGLQGVSKYASPARLNHLEILAPLAATKRPKGLIDAEMMEKARRYTQMKELQRLRKEGGSFDALKDSIKNGERVQSTGAGATGASSYKKFIGTKGSLEKRLQAIVAYKRASGSGETADSGLSAAEEEELEVMMESDEGDEELDLGNLEDDEEAEYEALVLQAIETNKLNELKKNFMLDKAGKREEALESKDSISSAVTTSNPNMAASTNMSVGYDVFAGMIFRGNNPSAASAIADEDNKDLYTPARSSWGVFERPRDVSKTFGGGRSITKEEMDRMDEEFETREKNREAATETWRSATLQKEIDNEKLILQALDKSRGLMIMGNRKGAVQALENVSELCSWQSELGGEVLLELGMALETVERTDDARKVYGKLASVSWSTVVRRNSLQLIQGLDITKQIRKDVSPRKPAMDMQNLYLVQAAIEKGLLMDSDEYRRERGRDTVAPWFDEEKLDKNSIETIRDAYGVLRRAIDPLRGQKVASSLLIQAFRRFHMVDDVEKMDFLSSRGVLTSVFVLGEKPKILNRVPGSSVGPPLEGTFFAMIADSDSAIATGTTDDRVGYGSGSSSFNSSGSSSSSSSSSSSGEKKSIYQRMSEDPAPVGFSNGATNVRQQAAINKPSEVFALTTNGTWDLVISLFDNSPYAARRFESGELRRVFGMKERQITETVPTLWGLGTSTLSSNFEWNESRCQITLLGQEFSRSRAPWHTNNKGSLEKVQLVAYADEDVMVMIEPSNSPNGGGDLYTLWKRKTTQWRKF